MELRQLEYFVAVADTGSFTRAARQVHVVQSGVSAAVQALERELGVVLFDRTTRRVTLTSAGSTLATHARLVLDEVVRTRESLAQVADGMQGSIRLGVMHSLVDRDVAATLAAFHRERPSVRLVPSTHARGSAGLISAVVDGELDLALAAVDDATRDTVDVTVLRSEPLVLVCPRDHRLAERTSVAVTDLGGETFVDVPAGWGSRAAADAVFSERCVSRRVEIEVGDVATVVQLVRAGLGIAVLALTSAPVINDLMCVRLRPAPRFRIGLITPRERRSSPAAQALAEALRVSRP